ncbi:flagellar export chaperone FlgN [Catenovulum adriaticum]|uniref:Flagellar export chaperone FlgN n=1 Tax=Catenovulum adriaticum TaxID=2984846 RepID=A0ABY7AIK3_9ALTE|nr:flagellar export chaperone FlgN [Catenovulum sp. TS8]WAJ69433.1 flagellar export chaperone FlgN [Catenovulum sp. TS8]
MSQHEALLAKQQSQLEGFTQLLNDELVAYKQRKSDEVYNIAVNKNELLTQIQQTDQQISQLENLSELKKDEHFNQAVAKLDELLADIKTQSAINERVIRTSLNNVLRLKQSILALKNSDAMTYDKQGQAQTQTLGKGIKA